jgi:hypothetical protein
VRLAGSRASTASTFARRERPLDALPGDRRGPPPIANRLLDRAGRARLARIEGVDGSTFSRARRERQLDAALPDPPRLDARSRADRREPPSRPRRPRKPRTAFSTAPAGVRIEGVDASTFANIAAARSASPGRQGREPIAANRLARIEGVDGLDP